MSHQYHSLAFTTSVLEAQSRYGSRLAVARYHRAHGEPSTDQHPDAASPAPGRRPRPGTGDALTDAERQFIGELDGFYLATVSETGWPYVQYRGGPAGFAATPDEHTIAWADFRGNRQYISTGNLALEGRTALIFMDYARQTRLKVYGWATVRDVPTAPPRRHDGTVTGRHREHPDGASQGGSSLAVPGYPARVEREVRIDVVAYDWNCPQHITPRYTVEELASQLDPVLSRVAELEEENRRLRTLVSDLRREGPPSSPRTGRPT